MKRVRGPDTLSVKIDSVGVADSEGERKSRLNCE